MASVVMVVSGANVDDEERETSSDGLLVRRICDASSQFHRSRIQSLKTLVPLREFSGGIS
jgi:hypothetical protein